MKDSPARRKDRTGDRHAGELRNDSEPTSPLPSIWARRGVVRLTPWLMLTFSLFITWVLWLFATVDVNQSRREYFNFRVRETVANIEKRMETYEQVLRGVRGLFEASANVERTNFRDYVASLRLSNSYPGIQGIGFSLIIPAAEKDKHLTAVRQEGFPEYAIRPEGERDPYTSIIYLEPFRDRNLKAFGYDMYSEPVRRAAMECARDTDDVAMSGKVRLVQESGKQDQAGFLMYFPIYVNGLPKDELASRRANIIGWVYSPFRMNDLMSGIHGEHASDLDIEIFDGTEATGATLLYDSAESHGAEPPRVMSLESSSVIEIAAHVWTINIHALPGISWHVDGSRPALIAVAGILISVLLAGLTWLLLAAHERSIVVVQTMRNYITEHKRFAEALRRSEERYRTLFSSSQDAFMTVDPPAWRFTSGNSASLSIFGIKDEEELISLGFLDLCPNVQPDGRLSEEKAKEMIETAMRKGSLFIEWTQRRIDGSEFPATILLTRVDIGDHAFLQATVRDITRQKQMELELTQAQKLEAVGRLAAGIAHEINTPTQYVGDNIEFLQIAYASLLDLARVVPSVIKAGREGPIPPPLLSQVNGLVENTNIAYLAEQVPRAIEQSLEGIGRIATIVQAMKEFSHPGVVEKTTVDLNQCIRSTATVSRNEWKYVADLNLELDDALPQVLCLPGEFNQAILNMIVNAAHAIGDAAGDGAEHKGKITISTRQDGAWAEVRIADTGTGIPEEIRGRIFDPFFTTKEVGRGTGQGLAVARNVIVDKHGGTLAVESKAGKGTAFILRLPIESVELAGGALPSDGQAG